MALGDWYDPFHVQITDSDDLTGCVFAFGLLGTVFGMIVYLIVLSPFCIIGYVAAEKGMRRSESCKAYMSQAKNNIWAGTKQTAHIIGDFFNVTGQALNNFDRND